MQMEEPKTIKVFLSMPLKDLSKEEVEETLKQNKHDLIKPVMEKFNVTEDQIEVMDTHINAEEDMSVYKTIPLYYFGKGIMSYLSKADVIVMGHGWRSARGCQCENFIAAAYGIPQINLDAIDRIQHI